MSGRGRVGGRCALSALAAVLLGSCGGNPYALSLGTVNEYPGALPKKGLLPEKPPTCPKIRFNLSEIVFFGLLGP